MWGKIVRGTMRVKLLHEELCKRTHCKLGQYLPAQCWVPLYIAFDQIGEEEKLRILCTRLSREMKNV
jgi:hypothetical protein